MPLQPHRESVLLVEDEPMLREMLTACLRGAGFQVAPAADGVEALGIFRRNPRTVQMLVTDIHMPFLSGLDLADAVTRGAPACPVLLISGFPLTYWEEVRWEFLAKPFSVQHFVQSVERLLAARPQDSETMRPRVMLAENDSEIRRRLCGILSANYDVVAAVEEGSAVLEKAEELHPEVILLDIGMPGMNGFAVARILRRAMPSVPLLFVTQHADPAYVEEAFASGVAGYVLKRNVVNELRPALEQVRSGGRYISPGLRAGEPQPL